PNPNPPMPNPPPPTAPTVAVPSVVGLDLEAAKKKLDAAGLGFAVVVGKDVIGPDKYEQYHKGWHVARQTPAASDKPQAKKGTAVTCTLDRDPPKQAKGAGRDPQVQFVDHHAVGHRAPRGRIKVPGVAGGAWSSAGPKTTSARAGRSTHERLTGRITPSN